MHNWAVCIDCSHLSALLPLHALPDLRFRPDMTKHISYNKGIWWYTPEHHSSREQAAWLAHL